MHWRNHIQIGCASERDAMRHLTRWLNWCRRYPEWRSKDSCIWVMPVRGGFVLHRDVRDSPRPGLDTWHAYRRWMSHDP